MCVCAANIGFEEHIADNLHASFKQIKNLSTIMRKHKQSKARLPDWSSVKRFLSSVFDVCDIVFTLSGWRMVDLLQRIAEFSAWDSITALADLIDKTVLFRFLLIFHHSNTSESTRADRLAGEQAPQSYLRPKRSQ